MADEDTQSSLNSIAREIMIACKWNPDTALKIAMSRSKKEPELLEMALQRGWQELLRGVETRQRDRLMSTPVAPGIDRGAAYMREKYETFLATYFVSNVQLCKASKADLMKSISFRRSTIETMTRYMEFESALLKGMKGDGLVPEYWSEEQIAKLAKRFQVALKEAA